MTQNLIINLNVASDLDQSLIPELDLLHQWSHPLVKTFDLAGQEVALIIVGKEEAQQYNHQYRNKDYPTNILSFPFEISEFEQLNIELETRILGDLIVCWPLIIEEAQQQHKTIKNHFAHLLNHGLLHLLGYDHLNEQAAEEMENLEIEFLKQLGIANPYLNNN